MNLINTKEDFNNAVSNNGVIVIKIGAEWCGPCKVMNKVISAIEQNCGNNFATFYEADADSENVNFLTEKYDVMNLPTFLFFKDGIFVKKLIGAQAQSTLVDEIEKI